MPRKRITARISKLPSYGTVVLRSRQLEKQGLTRTAIRRLVVAQKLERVGRGLYMPSGSDVTENHALAEACARVPGGVICLLTALRFHELTTQLPSKVWIAIRPKAWKPKVDWPTLRIVRFSPELLAQGTELHDIEGVQARITSKASTVADCFRYRNQIGVDVAIEALREYRLTRQSIPELEQAAKKRRISSVLRPYLEAIL